MDTRPDFEAIWRGSCCILVICSSRQIKEKFKRSRLKFYWGNECNAEGMAQAFFGLKDSDKKVDVLLELSEIAYEYENWPDRMEVILPDQTINLPIVFEEQKKNVRKTFIADYSNEKGLPA